MFRQTLIKALSVAFISLMTLTAAAQTADTTKVVDEWQLLIKAISVVESGENPKAVNGQHAGLLQISPICVRECNNIVGKKKYTYKDRFSREKSIEMFNVIQSKYNPGKDFERAIRLWNGGPGGVKYPSRTNKYYRRVMSVYEKLRNK